MFSIGPAAVLIAALLCAPGDAGLPVLWEIGTLNGSAAEFGHPEGGPGAIQDGAYYVAGWSQAGVEWPYLQAGPEDRWAGDRRHVNSIRFYLPSVPASGECTLTIDLANTHPVAPPVLRVALNGQAQEHATPPGGADDASGTEGGKPYSFTLRWPASVLQAGENVLRITSAGGSWMLYDHLAFRAPAEVKIDLSQEPLPMAGSAYALNGLRAGPAGLVQPVRMTVRAFGQATPATIVCGDERQDLMLQAGPQEAEILVPAVSAPTALKVVLECQGQAVSEAEVTVEPVRHWTLYLLHHTHLDIGYTHHQSAVERIQWQHMDKALELIEATKDYPPEARFVWLPEGLWAVDSYLKQASPEQQEKFIAAVKGGSIGLDALYGNQLTALCTEEELVELTGYARRLAAAEGVSIASAMITDVPGYTWGIVPVLAQSGVKYFSVGPNRGHRIGFTLSEWGDKPFYWVSPSGKERVLTWIHGEGYSWFHGGGNAAPAHRAEYEKKILGYLRSLQDRADYPWDIAILRYNIGGDNGPPDEYLPDFIRAWNETYVWPKLSMATTPQAFGAFEAKYGDRLPEFAGDFTPYWEDGAGSSARETGINREAAERIVQAQAVAAMTGASLDAAAVEKAWREVLLYDEHTWGAHNSITEPQSEFALQQWATKQAFALEAEKQSKALLEEALAPLAAEGEFVTRVGIVNPEAWSRSELVALPAEWKLAGDSAVMEGNAIPAQRLADGRLALLVRDVPAGGAVTVDLKGDGAASEGAARASETGLSNGLVSVQVDASSGAIVELRMGEGPNLAGDDGFGGLNAYAYVAGRKPDHPQPNGAVSIEVIENGPVVATVRISSDAPGCAGLVRELRVVEGIPAVYVSDTLDKTAVYDPEGVHIAFPFEVPGGVVRIDTPFAVVRPDADQLPGACKNYFTVQ
ncbi:MAG: hypothetical protein IT368_01290, partial [Candidatus Hydrogenedentes bacterium]|nr:hypothetical protein [Candidatus Hydrogenedentota bacterium]